MGQTQHTNHFEDTELIAPATDAVNRPRTVPYDANKYPWQHKLSLPERRKPDDPNDLYSVRCLIQIHGVLQKAMFHYAPHCMGWNICGLGEPTCISPSMIDRWMYPPR